MRSFIPLECWSVRCWLTNYGTKASANLRLKRLKHLIGVAPATFGSPQAHKGRTWLGALVKGNRKLGPDFLNAGDQVLDGLELGSRFTWDLSHRDLLAPEPYYDNGPATPYVCVFIGNQQYEGVAAVANDPGTDGTVRWAGCGLNTRKIIVDLTRTPVDQDGNPVEMKDGKYKRASISKWTTSRLDIPMIPVEGRNHSTILANPDPWMVNRIAAFLKVDKPEEFVTWLDESKTESQAALSKMLSAATGSALSEGFHLFLDKIEGKPEEAPSEGWQQFVIHAVDEHGDGVSDYFVEVLRTDEKGDLIPFLELSTDVHAYGADQSFRCFHVRLPKGISSAAGSGFHIYMRMNASTGTALVAYQGYTDTEQQLGAKAEPVELDISSLGADGGTLFYPFTTTLVEIRLNREPLPFSGPSDILRFDLLKGVAPRANS